MSTNDNYGKQNHIYDKQTRTWFEVTPEQFEEYDRWRTRIRKREQYHGRCMCPRSKWWLCDGMCQDCEYRASGDTISMDAPVANEDGDEVSKTQKDRKSIQRDYIRFENRMRRLRWILRSEGLAFQRRLPEDRVALQSEIRPGREVLYTHDNRGRH